jgi:hypothetical protein
MKRRYWIISIVVLLVLLGATLGLEIREVGDNKGKWTVVGRRVVVPWQPAPEAASLPEADAHPAVRVTRWHCYGLGFKHSQYHSKAK